MYESRWVETDMPKATQEEELSNAHRPDSQLCVLSSASRCLSVENEVVLFRLY